MSLLQVNNMTHYFGGLRAVYQYTLDMEPGQIRGLIGPNGAGKTTVFNLITGIHRPTGGTVLLEGEEHGGTAAPRDRFQGPRPDLSEPAAVAPHDRPGACQDGPLFAVDLRACGGIFRHPQTEPGREGPSRPEPLSCWKWWAPEVFASQNVLQLALRGPAAGGDGPGPGHGTESPLSG